MKKTFVAIMVMCDIINACNEMLVLLEDLKHIGKIV